MSAVDRSLQIVDQQIAGGHAKPVVPQPRHDRRTLSPGGACHQRHPIG
jgi:hypothetical protein